MRIYNANHNRTHNRVPHRPHIKLATIKCPTCITMHRNRCKCTRPMRPDTYGTIRRQWLPPISIIRRHTGKFTNFTQNNHIFCIVAITSHKCLNWKLALRKSAERESNSINAKQLSNQKGATWISTLYVLNCCNIIHVKLVSLLGHHNTIFKKFLYISFPLLFSAMLEYLYESSTEAVQMICGMRLSLSIKLLSLDSFAHNVH